MEDDWILCPHGMLALHYLIAKANDYYPEWSALRVSYGLNGVLVRSQDIQSIASFFVNELHQSKQGGIRPPDHIIYDWFMSKAPKRKLIVFRYNIFFHIGTVSTFVGRFVVKKM